MESIEVAEDAINTSSEDELLAQDGEEAAAWLVDVGLEVVVETLLKDELVMGKGGKSTEAALHGVVAETSHHYQTVKKRVETLRATLKSRNKNRALASAHQQRPDCRDIFRHPTDSINIHSGGSSGRSRSATPDSLDAKASSSSTENLLSTDDDLAAASLVQLSETPPPDYLLLQTKDIVSAHRRRRSNAGNKSTTPLKGVGSYSGFFSPAVEGHVAATDKQGIEIVKYKAVGTLSVATGRRDSNGIDQLLSDEPTEAPSLSLDEGRLTAAQSRKLRQLALLEITTVMDHYGLQPVRKRRGIHVRSFSAYSQHQRGERVVFGVPLKKLIDKDHSRTPMILSLLVDQLKAKHLNEDGLLRVPANKQKMMQLQKLIETQMYATDVKAFSTVRQALDGAGPHELAGLLKQFFRQLPESIFTQDCVDLFSQVGDMKKVDDQLKALNYLIIQLPDANCQTLKQLLCFLDLVVEHSDCNRMTAANVATVMGPNLFPPRISSKVTRKNSSLETITTGMAYTSKTNRVAEILLTHQEELFHIPEEILSQLVRIKIK